MNKTDQLIIYSNKRIYLQMLIIMPIMIVCIVFLLLILPHLNFFLRTLFGFNIIVCYVFLVAKIFFYFSLIFFSLGFIIAAFYALFNMKRKEPLAILNQSGILIKHHNFILWGDIKKFDIASMSNLPDFIAIQVEDLTFLSKQSDLIGKISLFWSKIFGTPHITLSNFDTKIENVFVFAHRYIKKTEI